MGFLVLELYNKKSECCGCSACAAICPQNAIEMKRDDEGFLYPEIDLKKCIKCGKCLNVCMFKTKKIEKMPLHIFAVKNKDEKTRKSSSSGGTFTSLYSYVIHHGGVVYGAAFDSDFSVKHLRAETISACEKFRGSKYVQSDITKVFVLVKKDLLAGKTVLFSGTPCQVAGLKKYVETVKQGVLYTVDLVCHGAPSPLIWMAYLDMVGRSSKITYVNFRDKTPGWHNSYLKICSEEKVLVNESQAENAYMQLFVSHYSLRPSCGECPYANMSRSGDITLGDFWGIEKSMPHYDDDKGISLVLINTKNGEKIFDKIKNNLEVRRSTPENCMQPNLQKSSSHSRNRNRMWEDFNDKGMAFIMKYYTPYGNRFIDVRIKKRLKSIICKLVKRK